MSGSHEADQEGVPPETPILKIKKARLIALGYPWPEHLHGKSLAWVEAELRTMARGPPKGGR